MVTFVSKSTFDIQVDTFLLEIAQPRETSERLFVEGILASCNLEYSEKAHNNAFRPYTGFYPLSPSDLFGKTPFRLL